MRRVFVDPARVNLRKAARATLVVPLVFAFLVVVENAPAALFGSFGAFAALVFADFGGARRPPEIAHSARQKRRARGAISVRASWSRRTRRSSALTHPSREVRRRRVSTT